MIAIFGAPGAGKTVQGKLLQQKYGWEWISYQELMHSLHNREVNYALKHGMPVFIDAKEAAETFAKVFDQLQGKVSNSNSSQIINSLGLSSLLEAHTKHKKQVILDGFPSNYRELMWLVDNKKIKDIDGAIILRVPRGELWKRLVERKRVDDTRATIERRQDLYDRNITGMIKLLKANGIEVREVNGENSPKDVFERVEDILADWEMVPKKQFAKIKKPKQF